MIVGGALSFFTAAICPSILCPILAAEVLTGGAVIVGSVESLTLLGGTRIFGIGDRSVTVQVDCSSYPNKREDEKGQQKDLFALDFLISDISGRRLPMRPTLAKRTLNALWAMGSARGLWRTAPATMRTMPALLRTHWRAASSLCSG
jgi:hypothetical protein